MMLRRNTTLRDRHRTIIARDQPPCAICGQPIDYQLRYPHPKSFVVDHIIPIAAGGTDTLDNKQAAHRDCNRAKGDKPHAPAIRRSTSLTWPDRHPTTDPTTPTNTKGGGIPSPPGHQPPFPA